MDRDAPGWRWRDSLGQRVKKGGSGDAERAQWRAVVGGGGRAGGMGGGSEKCLRGMKRKVVGEVGGGVGPEIKDDIEAREPGGKISGERGACVERGPAGFVLGMDGVEEATGDREAGGGGVAGELDAGGGGFVAERCERGEGDDEITERAASKNEDAAHRWLGR